MSFSLWVKVLHRVYQVVPLPRGSSALSFSAWYSRSPYQVETGSKETYSTLGYSVGLGDEIESSTHRGLSRVDLNNMLAFSPTEH